MGVGTSNIGNEAETTNDQAATSVLACHWLPSCVNLGVTDEEKRQ